MLDVDQKAVGNPENVYNDPYHDRLLFQLVEASFLKLKKLSLYAV